MSATGVITFDGKASSDYALTVERYPNYQKPQRKMDVYSVPGRTGDILHVQDAWEDVKQEYDIFAGTGEDDSVPDDFSDVADWLYSAKGYCVLRDDFDSTHYRKAYFSGPFDVENLLSRTGRATISFTCKAPRYRDAGTAPIVVLTSSTISNPTAFASRPLLKVEGTQSGGTVTVNGTVFTISNLTTPIFIDCEEMNCYDLNGNNRNGDVSSSTSEFAILKPGSNSVSFTGNITKVTVTPFYWDL